MNTTKRRGSYTGLNPRQRAFVRNISQGMTARESAIRAGYSPLNPSQTVNALFKNKDIHRALDRAGISDEYIGQVLKGHIEQGRNIKNTAETSLRAVELALKLKGQLGSEQDKGTTNNTVNIIVNELKSLDDDTLKARLSALQADVVQD